MWRYKILLLVLFIPLVLYTLWQSLRAFEFRYFLQRFALYYSEPIAGDCIWIHAASVGEVNAATPLILKIQQENPAVKIVLSSNTITSAHVAKTNLPEHIHHIYFPLDYAWAMNKLLRHLKPHVLFIVETEFWPNLYLLAHRKKIPFYTINGRISEKTLHAKPWLKQIYAKILPLINYVYARSETDQERFLSLGADAGKIETLGNIKLALSETTDTSPIELGRPYVLAASTREDEEQIIVAAWKECQHQNHILVIVPRHPNRIKNILSNLNRFDYNIAVRSKKDPVTNKTDIYIADTIGELKNFIAGSEFVLMGGSFVPKGGHNILEVAQLGKAVVFGPDMRNFEDEASLFRQFKAGIQCKKKELGNILETLISDNSKRALLEEHAHVLIRQNNNVEKYIKHLTKYFS